MRKEYYGLIAVAVFAFVLLAGCPQPPAPGSDRDAHGCIPSAGYSWCEPKQKCIRLWEENCTTANTTVVGGDRDAHGCIPSAGYTWCEEKQKCIRPWEESCKLELAEAKQIAMAAGSECAKEGTLGDYSDYRSNNASGNFWWFELKVSKQGCGAACIVYESNRSTRVNWMCTGLVPEEAGAETGIEAEAKKFCGTSGVAKVYTCGPNVRVVSALMGGGSTFYDVSGNEVVRCPVVAPDMMSEQCRLLVLGNNCVEKEIC